MVPSVSCSPRCSLCTTPNTGTSCLGSWARSDRAASRSIGASAEANLKLEALVSTGRVRAHEKLVSNVGNGSSSVTIASHRLALTPRATASRKASMAPVVVCSVAVRVAARADSKCLVIWRPIGSSFGSNSSGNTCCTRGGITGVSIVTTKLPCSVWPRRTWFRYSVASRLAPARYTGRGSWSEQAAASTISLAPTIRSTPALTGTLPSSPLSLTRRRITSRSAVTRSRYRDRVSVSAASENIAITRETTLA